MNNLKKGSVASLVIVVLAILVVGGIYVTIKKTAPNDFGAVMNDSRVLPGGVVYDYKGDTSQDRSFGGHGFLIHYPYGYRANETEDSGFFNELGIFEYSIRTPEDYQKGTDLDFGRVSVSVSSSTRMCYTKSSDGINGFDLPKIKKINGVEFHYADPYPDSAMGGQRGVTSWMATIHNDDCYRIERLVAYHDIRGFTEPPYPPHFDEKKLNSNLDLIISTFRFTN